jgi:putative nucleotidyltransferase with HDIG domain
MMTEATRGSARGAVLGTVTAKAYRSPSCPGRSGASPRGYRLAGVATRPFIWLVNAAQRTFVACLPALARPGDEFAREYLEPPEYSLYLGMDRRDRQHACQVARKLLARRPAASRELVRAALLHDVGKADQPYNALHRIIAHLYAPEEIPAAPRLRGLRGAWQAKRHHHLYGAAMIRRAGGGRLVADLVERHHDPAGDPDAALLKSLDDET